MKRQIIAVYIALILTIQSANPAGVIAKAEPPLPATSTDQLLTAPQETAVNFLLGLPDSALKASGVNGGNEKRRASDGSITTRWSPPDHQGPSAGHYWAANLTTARSAASYRIAILPPAPSGDFASALNVYGSNDPLAWSWLPGGKITSDPVGAGWTLVDGYSGKSFPIETGRDSFDSVQTYRYWLFYAVAGGAGSNDEFDINEVELWDKDLTDEQTFGLGGTGHGNRPVHDESDPVNTATGNFATQAVDVSLPGQGLGFSLVRTYNSLKGIEAEPSLVNLVRTPVNATATYSASRSYDSSYLPPTAADGQTSNTSLGGFRGVMSGAGLNGLQNWLQNNSDEQLSLGLTGKQGYGK